MLFQNSYIFIPNPFKKEVSTEKKDNAIYVEARRSIISYLKNSFPTAVRIPSRDNFFKSEYTFTIEIDGNEVDVKFLIHEVIKKYYLDVIVIGKSKMQIVKSLEFVQDAIEKSDISKDYIEIISYDAISEYYCNKIYPKLNELERNLRKLLFNIYIVNFGKDYYQKTINGDLQKKIKSVIQAKGNEEKKEIERIQKFFYSMEFTDIQQMLFVSNWTEIDEKSKDDFLKTHEDLSKLTDDKLRKTFSEIAPRSDWERFFANKMDADVIHSLINEIRVYRNNIAHCKFFYKTEYTACNKAMGKFNKAVKQAITITEDKDFYEKNSENITKALIIVAKQFEDFKVSMADVIRPMAQLFQQISDTIAPIRTIATKNLSLVLEAMQPAFQSLSQSIAYKPPNNIPSVLLQHHNGDENADNDDC